MVFFVIILLLLGDFTVFLTTGVGVSLRNGLLPAKGAEFGVFLTAFLLNIPTDTHKVRSA
jgi:hypothetical protein